MMHSSRCLLREPGEDEHMAYGLRPDNSDFYLVSGRQDEEMLMFSLGALSLQWDQRDCVFWRGANGSELNTGYLICKYEDTYRKKTDKY